jgi:iron complex outermembrane recepter protein
MKYYILVLLFALQFAFAQNKKDSINGNLDEVVVTANRSNAKRNEVPVAITKLSQKLISETKAASAYEILNKTPGVLMVNLGNEQHSLSIRQPMSFSNYYLFLEDGLPIRPLGIFNHNALLEINQFNLQNIEVVKGPVSSLYGPEAVGGTINFISKKPTETPEFLLGVQSDNFGYRNFQAFGSATVGKFSFTVAGLTSEQKNSWLKFSDYTKNNLNVRLEYAFSNRTRLKSNTMVGSYYSDMTGSLNEQDFLNRTYKSQTDFTYRKSDALRTRLTLEHDWNEKSQSFVTTYYRDNKLGQNPSYGIRWNPVASANNDPNKARGEINSNDFKSYGVVAQHSQTIDFFRTKLIAGGTYDYSPNDYFAYQINLKANLNPDGQTVNNYQIIEERPDLKISNYNAKIYNKAGYLQFNIQPLSNMMVTVGTRYDHVKIDYINNVNQTSGSFVFDKLTSKMGINFNPTKDLGFYTNFAQGFAPPNVTSVFRPKPNVTPVQFYTDLKPARFNNYEIGGWVNLFKNKLNVEFAAYILDGRNELINIRQPDNSNDTQSAGRTTHRGIELGINYKPSRELWLRIGGTVAKHEFLDFEISTIATDKVKNLNGFEMPSAPRWIGNSEVNYYPKWIPNLRAAVEWQYVSSWYQNQINTVKYKGYNVLNARVGYQLKQVELFANLLNLTDALYAYNTTRGNGNNDQSTYTASAPRTIMFGLQYHFKLK